ncbi:MAG: mobilization A domain protein [Merismopedia sp. SIO2A8]|nr:mobilization A domain protein [Symploca sp. SIO2E9]NET07835.1 mobilization A domain protein [Symploca sp. SIO2B6]NET49004.1 mobilization A domain protein [Merismopedia sp. SIO2A8]
MVFQKRIDRTYLAVRRQLQGMRCSSYEVGLFDRRDKQSLRGIVTYSQEQVLNAVGFLKSKNASGHDIFIRPKGSQGLLLLDDVSQMMIGRMKPHGDHPAAIIQTSPANYQVWVRVSNDPLEEQLATEVARSLARDYGADISSADWRHFGRLAGFTNQKPEHRISCGYAPYVLAEACQGKICPSASRRLALAQKSLAAIRASRQVYSPRTLSRSSKPSPKAFYTRYMSLYLKRYGEQIDKSRMDFAILRKMAQRDYTAAEMAEALREASPGLAMRKAGHEEDYITRTVRNVLDEYQSKHFFS